MDENMLSAYCGLAEAIALQAHIKAVSEDKLLHNAYPGVDKNKLIFFHDFMSTFERIGSDLVKLKIIEPINIAISIFITSTSEYRSVAETNWRVGPSFDELLQTFVEYFGEYGGADGAFETRPDTVFRPREELIFTFDRLAELGYVDSAKDGYVWTEKIRSFMYHAGYWSEHPETD